MLSFNPGQKGSITPYKSHEVTARYAPDEWIKHQDLDWDIAILKLSAPIGKITGFYGFTALGPLEGKGLEIRILGYPTQANGEMWLHKTIVTKSGPERLVHEGMTLQGESGSPIFVQNNAGQIVVIGVHTYREDGYAFGPKITAKKRDFIVAHLS